MNVRDRKRKPLTTVSVFIPFKFSTFFFLTLIFLNGNNCELNTFFLRWKSRAILSQYLARKLNVSNYKAFSLLTIFIVYYVVSAGGTQLVHENKSANPNANTFVLQYGILGQSISYFI